MLIAGRVGEAPTPPKGPILIYDSDCEFCCRWVARLKRLDGSDLSRLIPLQDPAARALSGRGAEQLRMAAPFVRPDGEVFAGAAAVREAARYLRGGSLVLGVAAIPGAMPLAERLYGWVARRWGPVE